jgi:hypothetical protein
MPWPPPLLEHSTNPAGFNFAWRMLHYVFGLSDPRNFPPLPEPLDEDSRARLERFVEAAKELAESAVLNGSQRVTIDFSRETGVEQVTTEAFASKELMRGFSALFRQFDGEGEEASFLLVSGRLYRAAATSSDENRERRLSELTAWRKARGRLHGRDLKGLVAEKLSREGRFGGDPLEKPAPAFLFSAYNYGDYLHWGEKRALIEDWRKEPFVDATRQMDFLEAASGLAHLYLGFGVLVRAALGIKS